MTSLDAYSSLVAFTVLITTIICNSVALSNQGWYLVQAAYPKDQYGNDVGGVMEVYGLTSMTHWDSQYGCVDKLVQKEHIVCTRESNRQYDDWIDDTDTQHEMKTASTFTMAFLIMNIVLVGIFLLLETCLKLTSLQKETPKWFKYVDPYLCASSIPLQVVAVICWAALFPLYNDPTLSDGVTKYPSKYFTIGTAMVLMICSIVVGIIGAIFEVSMLMYQKFAPQQAEQNLEKDSKPNNDLNVVGTVVSITVLLFAIGCNIFIQVDYDFFEIKYLGYYGDGHFKYGLHGCKLCNQPYSYTNPCDFTYEDLGALTVGSHEVRKTIELLRIAGALASLVFCLGIYLMGSLLVLELLHLFSFKHIPSWFGKVRPYLCASAIPFQVLGLVVWAAVFPCYDKLPLHQNVAEQQHPDGGYKFMGGRSFGILMASIALCCVGAVAVQRAGRNKEETELPRTDEEMEMLQKSMSSQIQSQ